jgi:hypothetical protein
MVFFVCDKKFFSSVTLSDLSDNIKAASVKKPGFMLSKTRRAF